MASSLAENQTFDTNPENEQLKSVELVHRHARFQSFVNQYGTNDVKVSRVNDLKQFLKRQLPPPTCLDWINAFLDKIPLLRCLKEYDLRRNLFGDIIAGITVAIMHIPQGNSPISNQIGSERTSVHLRDGLWSFDHITTRSWYVDRSIDRRM